MPQANLVINATVLGSVSAPTLSGVSATATNQQIAVNWTTDQDDGNGYVVLTTSSTAISYARIIAGQNSTGADAVASGMTNVVASGAQPAIVFPGIPPGTYFAHIFHRSEGGDSEIITTAQVTVEAPAPSDNGISIEQSGRSTMNVAPEAITFRATPTGTWATGPASGQIYDPDYHDITYQWTVSGQGQFSKTTRLPASERGRGDYTGPLVTITFSDADTYTVTCIGTHRISGISTTESFQITVGDQDAAFPGNRTIFVDNTGAGTGAPSGANVVSSIAAAISAVRGQQANHMRIMLRAGQEFDWPGFGTGGQDYPGMYWVGQPGTGLAAPLLVGNGQITWEDTANNQPLGSKDMVFSGINTDTGWNSITRLNDRNPGFTVAQARADQTRFMLIFRGTGSSIGHLLWDNCEMNGHANTLQTNDPREDLFVTLNNSVVSNWSDNAVLCDVTAAFSIVGCVFYHDTGAMVQPDEGLGNSQYSNTEYGIRVTPRRMFMQKCDAHIGIGWVSNNEDDPTPYFNIQPFLRLNPQSLDDTLVNISRNTIEAGDSCIETKSVNQNYTATVNAVIERNRMLVGLCGRHVMNLQMAGTTARNNVMIFSSADNLVLTPQAFVTVEHRDPPSAFINAAPTDIYGNAMINLRDDASYANWGGGTAQLLPAIRQINIPAGRIVRDANNVLYQPNIPDGDTDGAVDLTSVGITPRQGNYVAYNQTTPISGTANGPNDFARGTLLSGAAAIGDMDYSIPELVPYDDFNGTIRPASNGNRGAFASAA